MSAICPAGPPNDVSPILAQTFSASGNVGGATNSIRMKSPKTGPHLDFTHDGKMRRAVAHAAIRDHKTTATSKLCKMRFAPWRIYHVDPTRRRGNGWPAKWGASAPNPTAAERVLEFCVGTILMTRSLQRDRAHRKAGHIAGRGDPSL